MTAAPRLVPLSGRGATALVWIYFATMAILAVWSIGDVRSPWPTIASLLLFGLTCFAVTTDPAETLGRAATGLVVITWPVIALVISWQLIEGGGYAQWFLGAGTTSYFYLALRGRIGLAWVGFVALSVVILIWGATTPAGPLAALLLVGKQAPVLLVGTLFAVGMRRTGADIQRITDEESARASAEAAAAATSVERQRRLAELDAAATPLLTRLVSGAPLTDEDRREFAVVEAELRDGLRARTLTAPSVVEAVRAARRRGVDVVLLDDSDPELVAPTDLETAITRVADTVREISHGRIVARLLPPGRGEVATILVETPERTHRESVPSSEPGAEVRSSTELS